MNPTRNVSVSIAIPQKRLFAMLFALLVLTAMILSWRYVRAEDLKIAIELASLSMGAAVHHGD